MTQATLGELLGISFQQVQKYENGKNRIGAGRLQELSHVLQVPVAFFFEGASEVDEKPAPGAANEATVPSYISDFLASSDGLALTDAFMRIPDAKIKRSIVALVEQIADDENE